MLQVIYVLITCKNKCVLQLAEVGKHSVKGFGKSGRGFVENAEEGTAAARHLRIGCSHSVKLLLYAAYFGVNIED